MNKRTRNATIVFTILLTLTIMYEFPFKFLYKQTEAAYSQYKYISLRSPICHNVLSNITNGKWIRKTELVKRNSKENEALLLKEQELDVDMNDYRIRRGIHTRLWRDDGKCGYKNFQDIPKGSKWPANVGAWCDPKSTKPCCSDEYQGACGTACDCPNCINMKTILHPRISEWTLSDSRCRRRNYTSEQACAVLRRFDKLYFVGDSFVRKMLRGLIITLRSDPTTGASLAHYDENNRNLCVGLDQFRFPPCNIPEGNVMDLLVNKTSFCGDDTPMIEYGYYINIGFAEKFLDLLKSLLGKKNTVIFIGNGFHDGCNAQSTQRSYFDPALKHFKEYYGQSYNSTWWPHIVFTYPDSPGLLTPLRFLPRNGRVQCGKFSNEMQIYFDKHNITYMDFRKLTLGLHSFDGTHYGIVVNLMKTQIMLNYLDFFQAYTT